VGFIIRVCRHVGVEVEGYVGKLEEFPRKGYFENIVYHKDKRIRVNLYCAWATQNQCFWLAIKRAIYFCYIVSV